jgi:UDP-N-acetylmuramoyl-L-alanyl-D-glutamate--2,6-diaminopimelate ligase
MTERLRASGATVSSGALALGPSSPRPLAELVQRLLVHELRGDAATGVSDVTSRSDEASPGSLFFCVPGAVVDGHDLAADAVDRGAAVLVVERWLGADVTQVRVPVVREAMGPASAAFFGDPSRRMRAIGITGTNGKTTVTYLVEAIVRAAGGVPGVVGTTGVHLTGQRIAGSRTTPEAPELQRTLSRMVEVGVDTVAVEVSSHGLDQHRVDGTAFAVAAFTNLTQDHLDYHGTMDAYFASKARLFTPALAAEAVIDVDSPWGRRMAEASRVPTLTFGTDEHAELRATDLDATPNGTFFRVDGTAVRSALLGSFNASNCLAAFAVARRLGIADDAIARGIASVTSVPGRVEPVDREGGFLVLVDYAHTPDGLASVLLAARPLARGRLVVVFGCGGDRDRAKRPMMGRAAAQGADLAIITSDNPRSEDPLAIIADVERGARDVGGAYEIEPDRAAAIRRAVRLARPGDVVVLAGKGHEAVQELADGTIPFDDRDVAAGELRAIRGGA